MWFECKGQFNTCILSNLCACRHIFKNNKTFSRCCDFFPPWGEYLYPAQKGKAMTEVNTSSNVGTREPVSYLWGMSKERATFRIMVTR